MYEGELTSGVENTKVLVLSPFYYPEPISTGRFNTKLCESLRDRV
jgi:hypothetical protein